MHICDKFVACRKSDLHCMNNWIKTRLITMMSQPNYIEVLVLVVNIVVVVVLIVVAVHKGLDVVAKSLSDTH